MDNAHPKLKRSSESFCYYEGGLQGSDTFGDVYVLAVIDSRQNVEDILLERLVK